METPNPRFEGMPRTEAEYSLWKLQGRIPRKGVFLPPQERVMRLVDEAKVNETVTGEIEVLGAEE